MKAAAFLPPDDLKTSIFRTIGMQEEDIWALGRAVVGAARGSNPKARADLDVAAARRVVPLRVESENSTHPRHANIVGWPDDESFRRQLAVELALAASLRLPPP